MSGSGINQTKGCSNNVDALQGNIASISTVFTQQRKKELSYENYEDYVFELLAGIHRYHENRHRVLVSLTQLKNLFSIDIPKAFRPYLFTQVNSLFGLLRLNYKDDLDIYQNSFAALTAFKGRIDQSPQTDADLDRVEWEELEKSVYLLTDWEEMIVPDCVQPIYLLTDMMN